MNEVFKINEDIVERANLIKRANVLFGTQKVMIKFSDYLEYIFDNVAEAILFGIYRFKEVDIPDTISECSIGNVGNRDMYIYMKTEESGMVAIIKSLESYKYKQSQFYYDQSEIDFILENNPNKRFYEDYHSKVPYLKKEINHLSINNSNNLDYQIRKILDRYFPNYWKEYWLSFNSISRISIEVTLNVELTYTFEPVINVPLNEHLQTRIMESFNKGGDENA